MPKSWSFSRVFLALINLFRYSFWIFILELLTHIIYSSSIQFYPELCHEFDGWTLAGLGYALPCLFFIKYFIIYGSVKLIASIDGFDMPNPPKCVSRIHLCRFLWRYFDHGLHLWLKEYEFLFLFLFLENFHNFDLDIFMVQSSVPNGIFQDKS